MIDREQSVVLTHNIELMECPKGVIPSLIRFQRFDDTTFHVGQPLYKFRALVITAPKLIQGTGDWEIDPVWVRYAVAVRQSTREDIKGASDDVDIGTRFDAERERERLFFNRYYDIVRGMRIHLFESYADICLEPRSELVLKGWEIGYGPINGGFCV